MDSEKKTASTKTKAKYDKSLPANECVRPFKLRRHYPSTVTELKKNGTDKQSDNSPGAVGSKTVKQIILPENMKFIPNKEVPPSEVQNLQKLKFKTVNGKELAEVSVAMPSKIQTKVMTRPAIIQKPSKLIKLAKPVAEEIPGQKAKITNITQILSDLSGSSFEEQIEESEEPRFSEATVQIINGEKVLSFNTTQNSSKPIIVQTASSDVLKKIAPNMVFSSQSKQPQMVTMKSISGYPKLLMVKKGNNKRISAAPEQFKQFSLVKKSVLNNQTVRKEEEKVIVQTQTSNPVKKRDNSFLDQPKNVESKRLCQDVEAQELETIQDLKRADSNKELAESSETTNISNQTKSTLSPKKDIMVIVPHDAEKELSKLSLNMGNEDSVLDDSELLFLDENELLETDNFIQDAELSSTSKRVTTPVQEETETSTEQIVQKSKSDHLLDKFSILEKAVLSVQDENLRAIALKALKDCGIKSKKKVPIKRPLPSKIINDSAVQTNVFSLLKEGEFLEADEEHENLNIIKLSQKTPKLPNSSLGLMTGNEISENNLDFCPRELDSMVGRVFPNQQNVFDVKSAFQQNRTVKAKSMLKRLLKDFNSAKVYDDDGLLGIHRAVIKDSLQDVQKHIIILKAAKQDIDVCTEDGQTSLELAVELEANTQITQKLLENRARPVSSKTAHDSALIMAAKKSLRILPLLLKSIRPEDKHLINAKNSEGFAAIHYCAQNGNLEGITELIRQKADVNLQDDRSGRTALFYAVDTKSSVPQEIYYEIAQKLVDNGAYSNIPTFSKHSVLTLIDDVKSHSLKIALNRAVR